MAKKVERHKYFESRFGFVCAFEDGLRWEVKSTPGAIATPDKLASEMEKYLGELRDMIAGKARRKADVLGLRD